MNTQELIETVKENILSYSRIYHLSAYAVFLKTCPRGILFESLYWDFANAWGEYCKLED